jgi:hypothetical protein
VAEPEFDPRGILATLDRHHVLYIVVGGFARVIQGADEVTLGVDIVPSRPRTTCGGSTPRSKSSAHARRANAHPRSPAPGSSTR